MRDESITRVCLKSDIGMGNLAPERAADMNEKDLYPDDMSCGTCHCMRGWHFRTYRGDKFGCDRNIGMTNPVRCPCTGFMATESAALRAAYEAEMGRLLFRAAVARQNAKDGAKYRSALP